MRNIVGQTPRGDDFFKRSYLINKIYRRLKAGNHIFLSAPRRAGKTSIMRYLEDNPKKGYDFVYINSEDIYDAEDFFKLVSEKLLNSEAVKNMTKAVENSKGIFASFAEKVSKIKVGSFEVQLNKNEIPKYKDELDDLMKKLDTEEFAIVIMLDEFPVTIENIRNSKSELEAVNFLHANRSIRQEAGKGIQFVYTGSVGLPSIAKKLSATSTLNDLNVLEIPPLTEREATEFAIKILSHYKVKYNKNVVPYMLNKLEWLMPFFVQLVIQVLIDEYEATGKSIKKADVDKAFERSSTHRSNLYFDNYLSRLDKSLSAKEAKVAKQILLEIANKQQVPADHFDKLKNAEPVLEILELDGYINSLQNKLRFNSPILRDWWKKYGK